MRPTIRTAVLAIATVALFLLSGGQALASHVSCGDTITQDTKLDSDLVNCPADGITVGADNITLDLNGHTIDGVLANEGQNGVNNSAGHSGVTVENGTIQEFLIGVRVEGARNNLITRLDEHSAGAAVLLIRADNNEIRKNSFSGCNITLFDDSDANLIWQNTLTKSEILLSPLSFIPPFRPTANRIEKNVIQGGTTAIALFTTKDTVVEKNNIIGNSGVAVQEGNTSSGTRFLDNSIVGTRFLDTPLEGNGTGLGVGGSDGTVIARNRLDHNAGDGLFLTSAGQNTLVERNFASGNGDDGIDVDSTRTPRATLTRNTANNNFDLGIEAVPGTIDGGGNKASGNGNPAQCLNVACK
jgi:Periplasmic copper-binding protein (NosD)